MDTLSLRARVAEGRVRAGKKHPPKDIESLFTPQPPPVSACFRRGLGVAKRDSMSFFETPNMLANY
jgi:hypothetical protein